MIAAADGSGPPEPAGGIVGQFNLVDPTGAWIWNEGQPADIPSVDGERIVILDPPPYERSWNAGRIYPLMRPTLRVDAQLPLEEAAARLANAQPAQPTGGPPGWTDDLTIPMARGRTIGELVDLVLQAAVRDAPAQEIEQALVREFGLSEDDARLAHDRTLGGLVRAATRNPDNCPSPDKDPVAWESFQRATIDPALIARIYPQLAPGDGSEQ